MRADAALGRMRARVLLAARASVPAGIGVDLSIGHALAIDRPPAEMLSLGFTLRFDRHTISTSGTLVIENDRRLRADLYR
jgi:hypothetical protein